MKADTSKYDEEGLKEYKAFFDKTTALIDIISFELSTRNFRDRDEENLNIFDLLNHVDHVEKIIRDEYRKYLADNIGFFVEEEMASEMYEKTCEVMQTLLEFKNKWFISYNFWYSAFRADRRNRDNFNNGEEWLHITYQVQYPRFDKISKDIQKLFDEMDEIRLGYRRLRSTSISFARDIYALTVKKPSLFKRIFG